jgi:hypothetical protein
MALVEFSAAGEVQLTSKPAPSQGQLFESLQVPPPLRGWAASSSSKPASAWAHYPRAPMPVH